MRLGNSARRKFDENVPGPIHMPLSHFCIPSNKGQPLFPTSSAIRPRFLPPLSLAGAPPSWSANNRFEMYRAKKRIAKNLENLLLQWTHSSWNFQHGGMRLVVLYLFEALTAYLQYLVSSLQSPVLVGRTVREHFHDEHPFLKWYFC